MASIRKHNLGWQVRYYSDGRQQCEQFKTEKEAETRVAAIALAKSKGLTVEARPHTVKFGELAAAVVAWYDNNGLKSRDDIECRYRKHLIPVFGHRRAVSITTHNINAYISLRKTEGAPNGTINRELEAMKRAFKLALQDEAVARMPHIPRLKEDNVRQGFFTRAEVDRLCSFLTDPLNRFVLFGFLTGWRKSEISGLKWSNVDFERGQIRLDVGTTKSGEGRVFPITSELRALLEFKAPTKRRASVTSTPKVRAAGVATLTPFVFSIDGRPILEFRKTWARACFKAGLPCIVHKNGRIQALRLFHDLRRSGVRELARVLGEKRAMDRTGHKTRSIFDRYQTGAEREVDSDRELLEAANMSVFVAQKGVGKP